MKKDQIKAEELAPGILLDDFLPYLLNRISNRLNQRMSDDLKKIGQTTQSYRVLSILTARDGRSINELSVYSMTEQPTLSKIVERMERSGLVERRQSDEDGRIVNVYLTKSGIAAYAKILPFALEHYNRAIEGLSSNDHEMVVSLLHRVLENVRRSAFP